MHTITLFRGSKAWMAQHSDPFIVRTFGTDTIPTAFTPAADVREVAKAIARLHPGVMVSLAPGVLVPREPAR